MQDGQKSLVINGKIGCIKKRSERNYEKLKGRKQSQLNVTLPLQ
jgi:hypothetical protein